MDESTLHDRQRRAFEIAEAVLDHPAGAERDRLVAAGTAGDERLRAEVLALLAADGATHDLLDRGAAHMLPDDVPLPSDEPAPATLGDYRIIGELGRGGMGVVYDAERADGAFEQRVAVKVARQGGRSAVRAAARFDQERRVLARLRHPGIAGLLGGGLTDDGRPYFVLEYVDGVPLTDAAAGLDLDGRLDLFLQVCDAVAHAHRLLVVHRDLKPSNVLVERTDTGTLRARLLDFGIAKALDQHDAALTQTAAPLTPAYAAPEQVTGEPVTAATDVYALGMLLYELLTGVPAYTFGGGSLAEISRVVRETQPPRPSDRLAGDAHAEPSGAARTLPGVSPARLRGDLDAIVLQALRKEPERRYPTAADLADDVRRFLDHRPVEARGDSASYRVGRFVRRNRVAAGAALVTLLAIAGGVFGVVRQSQATALEAERARATLDWVLGTFDGVDPEALDGDAIQARDLIGPGLARIDELEEQPLVQASVMEGLGRLSLSLGLLPAADSLLGGAVRVRTHAQGADHPDVARARLLRVGVLRADRDYDRAESEARRAVAALGDAPPAARAEATLALAGILSRSDSTGTPERLFRSGLALAEQAGDVDLQLQALGDLGNHLTYRPGRVPEAVALLERAAQLAVGTFGPRDPRTARAWRGLAYGVELDGDPGRAADLLEQDLMVTRAAYGDNDHRVAQALYALGRLRMIAGDAAAAADYHRRAERAYAKSGLDSDHLWRAYTLVALGRAETEIGQIEAAQTHLRQGLDLYAQMFPPGDYRILAARGALGIARFRAGDAGGLEQIRTNWTTLIGQLDRGTYVGSTARPLGEALRDIARRRGDADGVAEIEQQLALIDG